MISTWLFKGAVQVIAHRGASAWHPEHTLAAYARAVRDGADFIEPDLVMSRDGVLLARHENELGASTDVADHKVFASRRTGKLIDGESVEGWFCEDFSIDELRGLRAREPLPALRSCAEDGRHSLLTFDEIVRFAMQASASLGRTIGVIPELKHSTYFRSIGLNLEGALLDAWRHHDYLQTAPFGIQSFEVGNLRELRAMIGPGSSNVFLVQLIGNSDEKPFDQSQAGQTESSYASMIEPDGLAEIAHYAEVIAPNKRMLVPLDPASGMCVAPTALVCEAHSAGLAVHAWTLRPENNFLPPALRCGNDPAQRCESGSLQEMLALLDAGVDAIFTDDPALGRLALEQHSIRGSGAR